MSNEVTLRDLIEANDLRYAAQLAAVHQLIESYLARVEEHFKLNSASLDKRFELRQISLSERFIQLEDSIEQRFFAQKEAVVFALAAAKEAVAKAEMAAERRFEGVNEFRASLSDQQRTLMPRSEAEVLFKAINDKVESNTLALHEIRGNDKGVLSGWSMAVGVVGLIGIIIGIVSFLIKRTP